MLAKLTSKNQLTLPKAVTAEVPAAEYFDVAAMAVSRQGLGPGTCSAAAPPAFSALREPEQLSRGEAKSAPHSLNVCVYFNANCDCVERSPENPLRAPNP